MRNAQNGSAARLILRAVFFLGMVWLALAVLELVEVFTDSDDTDLRSLRVGACLGLGVFPGFALAKTAWDGLCDLRKATKADSDSREAL